MLWRKKEYEEKEEEEKDNKADMLLPTHDPLFQDITTNPMQWTSPIQPSEKTITKS